MIRILHGSTSLGLLSQKIICLPQASFARHYVKNKQPSVRKIQKKLLMYQHPLKLKRGSDSSFETGKQFQKKSKDQAKDWENFLKNFTNFSPAQLKKKLQEEQPKQQKKISRMKALALASLIFFLFSSNGESNNKSKMKARGRKITEDQMLRSLAAGAFQKNLVVNRETIKKGANNNFFQTICLAKVSGSNQSVICQVTNLKMFLQSLERIPIDYKISFHYSSDSRDLGKLGQIISFLFTASLVYLGVWVFRKISSANILKGASDELLGVKKFEAIKPQNINTMFKDVAGMHEAKMEITQFVDFLKNPDRYIEMGAKIPKGALLTGPPGTGKTLLARACAGQAGVPFYYVSGSQFVEKYVGLGANRVRSLFEAASKNAPSIIFIDQIDAIGKKRDSGPFANQERDNTLNQLLVNMDGFDSKNKIIVMAATNLKDSLDPALLRPGRFDRSIQVTLPNFQERIEILKVHLQKVKYDSKFSIQELAKKVSILTPGFSGAELANICNQAAILAARQNREFITLQNFQKATERVMAGLQKRNLFSEEQKILLAYYQCGKAIVSWFSESSDPVIKISIAPFSKSSKGYSHTIKDEIPLRTKDQLLTKVCCYLAGRASQKHFKGLITTNGEADLQKAKRIIQFIVTKFGMSDSLQMIGFPDIEYVRKPYSEQTQAKIDQEIKKFTSQCMQKVQAIIIEKADLIEKLKTKILEKQTLTHHEIKQILGPRPFEDNQNYNKYLKQEAIEDKKKEGEVISGAGGAA